MAITEVMNIPRNAHGALKKTRNYISQQYGVEVSFTYEYFGEYEEIKLKGTPGDIRKAKKDLNIILQEANSDYEAYRERRSQRRRQNKIATQQFDNPSEPTKTVKMPKNPFAALGVDESHPDDNGPDQFPALAPAPKKKRVAWGPGMTVTTPPTEIPFSEEGAMLLDQEHLNDTLEIGALETEICHLLDEGDAELESQQRIADVKAALSSFLKDEDELDNKIVFYDDHFSCQNEKVSDNEDDDNWVPGMAWGDA